jgi:hypothetical protein
VEMATSQSIICVLLTVLHSKFVLFRFMLRFPSYLTCPGRSPGLDRPVVASRL